MAILLFATAADVIGEAASGPPGPSSRGQTTPVTLVLEVVDFVSLQAKYGVTCDEAHSEAVVLLPVETSDTSKH